MWARSCKVNQEFYVLAPAPKNERMNEWKAPDHAEPDEKQIARGDGSAKPGELAPEPANDGFW